MLEYYDGYFMWFSLLNDKYVVSKKCFISCNINAWSTEDIIKKWYKNIWDAYLCYGNLINEENQGFLILDQASSHVTENVIKELSGVNREIAFIPTGLTRFLQPLDVSINKPFKQALREKYVKFCCENGNENLKISRTKMIQFICDTWYDDNIITKEMVYKSFRVTGISNKLDRSEDDLFSAWKKMEEEAPLIEDDLEIYYKFSGEIDEEVLDDDDN